MLTRIYVDNFRCFVNFEAEFGPQQLLLGLNGSGKSSLVDVIRKIRNLVSRDAIPAEVFSREDLTRWQLSEQQTFELGCRLDEHEYLLKLSVDEWGKPAETRIRKEELLCDGRPIFEFDQGEVRLFNDHFERKVTYPFDWRRSALATIQSRPENRLLTRFKEWLADLHCLELEPALMVGETNREDPRPADDLSNFASWYRHLTQERAAAAGAFQAKLKTVLPGFESLDLRSRGGALRVLVARFAMDGDKRAVYEVQFNELSKGQRVLIALYAILEFLVADSRAVFIDEPENYLALAEIQPWLMDLADGLEEREGQVTVISHHPEMIDYMAGDHGIVLERNGAGPVRLKRYEKGDGSLLESERVARGWQE